MSISSALLNKIDISSQVEKHVTYFLHHLISFRYSSTTIQKQHIFRSVHSQHHRIPNDHATNQRHPVKISKLLINLVKHEKQYSPSRTAMLAITSRLQCHQILLQDPPTHPFLTPSLVTMCHPHIFLHVDWPSKPRNSLYIHHDHLIFQIFAYPNLTCFSLITITWYAI